MENLSSYDNDSLIKKFNDLKKIFQENLEDKALRDNLNVQLGELVTEMQKRNIDA